MTAELGDWLAELGESDPATAAEVAASLVSVLIAAEPTDLPTLSDPASSPPPDPRESADHTYQQLLEDMQRVRRSVTDMASTRQRAELRLGLLRNSDAGTTEIADAELADARRREEQLTKLARQLQDQVHAYRTAKESAKALYTATEAELSVAEALDTEGGDRDAKVAELRQQLRASAARLLKLAGKPAQPQYGAEAVPGVLELRANPLGSDVRILLAIEPADTVTLLAVLEGQEAVSQHGADAVKLASDLLTEIRTDGWPADIDEVIFANSGAFLARFFPDNGGTSRADDEA